MRIVVAHELAYPEMATEYGFVRKRVERAPLFLAKRPASVGMLLDDGLRAAGFAQALGRPDEEVLGHLRTAKDLAVALFVRGGVDAGVPVTVRLGEQELTVGGGLSESNTALHWQRAFGLVTALRDDAGRAALRAFDHARMQDNHGHDAFQGALAAGLQATLDGRDPAPALAEAEALLGEAHIALPFARRVGGPLVRLAQVVTSQRWDGFHETLVDSLLGYAALYRDPEHAHRADRVFPLVHIGLCALARDAGVPIAVTSGYLPPWLVRGAGV